MQKIKRILLSPKTVLSLIATMVISCLIGMTIPQTTEKGPQFFEAWKARSPKIYYLIDSLQLNQVYTSAWFLVLVALIAISLSCSIIDQLKILLRPRRFAKRSFKNSFSFKVPNTEISPELYDRIKWFLQSKGYRLKKHSQDIFFCKHSIGKWGSVVFHLGLLCIIGAALYSAAFQKRGFIQLIQTDTFSGKDEDWLVKRCGIFAGDFDLGFQVRLNRFTPDYWETDAIKSLQSDLTLIDEGGQTRDFPLSINNPIYFKGVKIYQSFDYGYTLSFILKKPGKKHVATHFSLDAPTKKDRPFVGTTDFPTTDCILKMKFYPNLIEPSFYLAYPGVDLTIEEKGEVKFQGRVLFSQRVRLGEDTLTFAQIHYWTGLSFVKNYGMPIAYLGFALSTLGAFFIYILPPKEIHLKLSESGDYMHVNLGGRSKRYPELFSAEFMEIAEGIKHELKGYHDRNSLATL